MTLIVGIRCRDGAIIAADSAVTIASVEQLHTTSDIHRKIEIVADRLIVAGTGQVGMGQRFAWILGRLWNDRELTGGDPVELSCKMAEAAINHFATTRAKPACGALVAFASTLNGVRQAEICEFAMQDFQPELKTDQLWYASMGSGQLLADPYLRLMRHVFWPDGAPSLQSGKFAAMWALRRSIEAAPGGISGPIDMAVLEFVSGKPRARMLSKEELAEHEESVKSATEHFRDFERILLGKASAAPRPPKP